MPPECPTCRAPEPHLHPQCGRTGEVQPCPDPFHTQLTAENTPEKIALMRRIRSAMAADSQVGALGQLHTGDSVESCSESLMDFKREILAFAQQALLRRGWTDIPLVVLTVVKGTEIDSLQGSSGNLWTRECAGIRQYMLEFARDTVAHHAANYVDPNTAPEPPRVLQ